MVVAGRVVELGVGAVSVTVGAAVVLVGRSGDVGPGSEESLQPAVVETAQRQAMTHPMTSRDLTGIGYRHTPRLY